MPEGSTTTSIAVDEPHGISPSVEASQNSLCNSTSVSEDEWKYESSQISSHTHHLKGWVHFCIFTIKKHENTDVTICSNTSNENGKAIVAN